MKTMKWDQFEFDIPESEQEFEIWISTPRDPRHQTLAAFADDVLGDGVLRRLNSATAFSASAHFKTDSELLEKFFGIVIPTNCAWPCYVVTDEWNRRQCLLDTGTSFISYRWSTSA